MSSKVVEEQSFYNRTHSLLLVKEILNASNSESLSEVAGLWFVQRVRNSYIFICIVLVQCLLFKYYFKSYTVFCLYIIRYLSLGL